MHRLLVPACAAFVLLTAHAASAASFAVTKTADAADGACNADCSLREAVIAANANPGLDRIDVPAGTYTLTRAGAGEDAAATGDLDVTGPTQIVGAGSDVTTVDAAGLDRVFHVTAHLERADFVGLTIRGGVATGAGDAGDGGGVFGFGTNVVLIGCVLTGNEAREGGGAAVKTVSAEQDQASLTVLNSTVVQNAATGAGALGGGLFFGPFVRGQASNSAILDNTSEGSGGGLVCGSTTEVEVLGSSVAGNTATGNGGGVLTQTNQRCSLRRTALEDNVAGGSGGGLGYPQGGTGVAQVLASAISGNEATAGSGGGAQGDPLILQDTEVTGNTAGGPGGGVQIGSNSSIAGCTIADNHAGTYAGGVLVLFGAFVRNTTITGNTAAATLADGDNNLGGGGLAMRRSGAGSLTLTLTNVTLADNTAPAAGGSVPTGRQLACTDCMDAITLRNTIVAGAAGVPQCQPGFQTSDRVVSGGGNLDSDGSCGLSDPSDQAGADADLGALGDNGGPARTRALGAASDALGAGTATFNRPANDQRGFGRDGAPDSGAFERLAAGFVCPADNLGVSGLLGYAVEDIVSQEVGDVVLCLIARTQI